MMSGEYTVNYITQKLDRLPLSDTHYPFAHNDFASYLYKDSWNAQPDSWKLHPFTDRILNEAPQKKIFCSNNFTIHGKDYDNSDKFYFHKSKPYEVLPSIPVKEDDEVANLTSISNEINDNSNDSFTEQGQLCREIELPPIDLKYHEPREKAYRQPREVTPSLLGKAFSILEEENWGSNDSLLCDNVKNDNLVCNTPCTSPTQSPCKSMTSSLEDIHKLPPLRPSPLAPPSRPSTPVLTRSTRRKTETLATPPRSDVSFSAPANIFPTFSSGLPSRSPNKRKRASDSFSSELSPMTKSCDLEVSAICSSNVGVTTRALSFDETMLSERRFRTIDVSNGGCFRARGSNEITKPEPKPNSTRSLKRLRQRPSICIEKMRSSPVTTDALSRSRKVKVVKVKSLDLVKSVPVTGNESFRRIETLPSNCRQQMFQPIQMSDS